MHFATVICKRFLPTDASPYCSFPALCQPHATGLRPACCLTDVLVDPYNGGCTVSESDVAELLGNNLQLPTTTANRHVSSAAASHGFSVSTSLGMAAAVSGEQQGTGDGHAGEDISGSSCDASGSSGSSSGGGSSSSAPLPPPSSSQFASPAISPPSGGGMWFERYLAPASVSDIVLRLLRNLREVRAATAIDDLASGIPLLSCAELRVHAVCWVC